MYGVQRSGPGTLSLGITRFGIAHFRGWILWELETFNCVDGCDDGVNSKTLWLCFKSVTGLRNRLELDLSLLRLSPRRS